MRPRDLTPFDFGLWRNDELRVSSYHLLEVTEAEFEKVDEDKNLCAAIAISLAKHCERRNKQDGKHLNNCCNRVLLNEFV